jgi:4-amino-4-deoxy-L-arabinose transferase-like glycosyltransferase
VTHLPGDPCVRPCDHSPVRGTRLRHPARTTASWWVVTLALVAVAGIALRVWTYRSALGVPDSDEAVVGLMARHVLQGEFSTFFWGQAYGGSQEALLTAPIFFVFGSGWLALRIVPMLLSAITAFLIWRVGRRLVGEPAAAVAGALFWIWPPFVIYELTHQWGFYASGVLYCALLLLLALRMVDRPSRLRTGLFGFVLGLALWQSEQIVAIALPLIAWTIWKQPRWLRQLWLAVPLAVLGALPSVVWNVRHGFGSLTFPVADTATTYVQRLRIFASPLLPMMVGLRTPFTQKPLLGALVTDLIYGALLALFLYGAYRVRHRSASLVFLIAAAFPLLFAVPPRSFLSVEPRYLVVLSPVLVLLLAQPATSHLRSMAVIALVCLISVVTLERMNTYFRTVPSQPAKAPRDISALVSTLDRLKLDRVYATYWVAYRLDFDTRERIIAAQSHVRQLRFVGGQAVPARNVIDMRWKPYERTVEGARHGFVFMLRETGAHRAAISQLRQWGYRRHLVGSFVVYALGE